jgi:hypothetical protein
LSLTASGFAHVHTFIKSVGKRSRDGEPRFYGALDCISDNTLARPKIVDIDLLEGRDQPKKKSLEPF